ncbi:hypothetical protein AOLI_G00006310 [Acnodon oligacanthus]
MALVVQEVLQPQELHSTQRTPVPPVHSYLQLTRLQTRTKTYQNTAEINAADGNFEMECN